MKKWKNRRRISMPGWILPLCLAPLYEILLHLGTMDSFVPGRFAAVAVFGLALGCFLAFLNSLLPAKASKWGAAVTAALLFLVYMAEFLIHNVFRNFMGLDTIGAGVAGVVSDYMRIVVDQILGHLGHMALWLLPTVVFCVAVQPKAGTWRSRIALALAAVVLYAGGVGIVNGVKTDEPKFREEYHFDSAAKAFGLHMAFVLDGLNDAELVEEELSFAPVETTVPTAPTTVPTEPAEEIVEETTEAPTEPPVVYVEQTLGLDFAALAEEERNSNIAELHRYVAAQPVAMTNDYTGLFAGKNLIFITAEAFCGPAFIDPELTPTLYRLMTEGIYFTEYYQPVWGASTTGGEYSNLVGLVPDGGSCMKEASQQNLFLTIGNQLQELGYSSAAFHNNSYTYYDRHKTHTHLGYDYFMGYGNGIEAGVKKQWPQSDVQMIDYTVPLYIDQQPFSVYYMTVSGHSNYNQDNAIARKNYSLVEHLDSSKDVRYYIATQMELEAALTSLLSQLEAAGILDDTVIVVASDHYPYGLDSDEVKKIGELMGTSTVNDFTRDRNTLIIWSGCIEDMDIVVDTPVSSLDILPTLSNLFGVPYDSRLLVGRDVFSDAEPLVFWGISKSWITDQGSYLASTKTFTPKDGVEVDAEYVERIHNIVRNRIKYSHAVGDYNYFNAVFDAVSALHTPEPTETTE